MANKSQLFSLTEKPSVEIKDLSEWKWKTPLVYKILLTGNPTAIKSYMWKYEKPIAIKGDFESGYELLKKFLALLVQVEDIRDLEELKTEVEETKKFLDARKGQFFLLEPGETYLLSRIPFEEQVEQLILEIQAIKKELDLILKTNTVLALESSKKINLPEIKKNWKDTLGIFWLEILTTPTPWF